MKRTSDALSLPLFKINLLTFIYNLSNFISIYSVPAAVKKFGFSLHGKEKDLNENLDHFNLWDYRTHAFKLVWL